MKAALQFVFGGLGLALATPSHGSYGRWHPPGHENFRGPCPMMNTLANHGFLPHDGPALQHLPRRTYGADYLTLDHLNRHNILEHDAGLSRADDYSGLNHIFNATVFAQTRSFWTHPTLTAAMMANSKVARQVISKAFNPTYTFTNQTEEFSLGEAAAPIIVFGDMDEGTVSRDWVEYFFHNERLPTELGWERKTEEVTIADVTKVTEMIRAAANLISDFEATSGQSKRANLHSGFRL
ncbi:hypothetical protein BDW74DRAFT_185861 [Aspergillus multicolor]|uniref:peroxidase family protein n=1 Tax=Aspergillus multicolor TaxID=41759 RepID=UPI003CCD2D57